MKILQVTTFYQPVVGGVETLLADLCKELADEGITTEILTTNSARNGKKLIDSPKTELIDGIFVTRVNTWFSLSEFHKFAPGFLRQLWKLDYDIIQVHGIRKIEGYMALLVAKFRHKKIIVTTHNPFTAVYGSFRLRLLIKLHDLTFGKLFMRFFDHYQIISATEVEKLAKFGIPATKISLIPNAVSRVFSENSDLPMNPAHLDPELQEKIKSEEWQGIVLSVGRLNYVKGFQFLLEAVKNNPRVLFIVVGGDDGYLTKLQGIFQDCKNIFFTAKYYSKYELKEVYNLADVFVLPSIHEPFGIVLLEAMASGCAVIATKNGGPVEILRFKDEYAGQLIDPQDQNIISMLIKEFFIEPDYLHKYQKLAIERAKDFSWIKILPQYLEMYNKLLPKD